MKNSVIGWRGGLCSTTALLLLCAPVGRATNSACNPGPALLNSFGTAGPTVGCFETDKSFTNFSVTNQGNLQAGLQTTGNIDISGSNTSDSPVTAPWTVTEEFAPAAAADWTATGTGAKHVEGTIGDLVDSSHFFIVNGAGSGQNNQYPTPTPGFAFYIDSVSLASVVGTTGDSSGAADTIKITEKFCGGNNACTAANTVTLIASIGNNSSTVSFTCAVGANITAAVGTCASPTSGVFDFATHVTTLTVTDQYNLVVRADNGAATTDTLTSFNNTFGEDEASPEPSTFGLLGLALTAVGLLQLRARRKA